MGYATRSSSNPLLAFLAGAAVWAFFGPKIKQKLAENEEWRELKSEVEKKYTDAKDYSQEAYNRIVDEVTDKYAKAKNISRHELRDLAEDLKMHWDRIKRAWN